MSESTPLQGFALKVAAAFRDLEKELAAEAGPVTARPGRPRAQLSHRQLLILREGGLSWRDIANELGAGRTTVRRIYANLRRTSS
jgi:DNA invertase Pin-like site-specific DNA recombinase